MADDPPESRRFVELECLRLTDDGYEWKEQARFGYLVICLFVYLFVCYNYNYYFIC